MTAGSPGAALGLPGRGAAAHLVGGDCRHAHSAGLLDERLAAGATDLGLNVFADNTTALGLYESLGYQPTAYQMVKPLL